MSDDFDDPVMSSEIKRILYDKLPSSLFRKAKLGMLGLIELEQILYDAGADMADVQAVMDEYIRLFGG